MIKNIVFAEWIKSKHSFTPWFLVVGSVLIPVICGLIYLNRWSIFSPEAGMDGWDAYLNMNVSLAGGLLFPFWVILLVALSVYPEYKGNAWKRLFVTPVGKSRLYRGKLIHLCFQVVITILGFMLSVAITGVIVGMQHPTLMLEAINLPMISMLYTGFRLLLCLLPMLFIQYVLSMLTRNMLIPVALGMFLVIVSLVLAQGWSYVEYDPYAFPLLFTWDLSGKMNLTHWMGLAKTEWLSLAVCLLVGWIGKLGFNRLSIK